MPAATGHLHFQFAMLSEESGNEKTVVYAEDFK